MIEDMGTYYRRRRSEELVAAERATHPDAAAIHRSLAARYAALAGEPQVQTVEVDQPGAIGRADGAPTEPLPLRNPAG